MLEPLLLSVIESPRWIDTSVPEVKAAVFRTEKGVLVLPMWLGKGAQYVPGQSAAVQLSMTVPQVPNGRPGLGRSTRPTSRRCRRSGCRAAPRSRCPSSA